MSLEQMAPPVDGSVASIGRSQGHSADALSRGRHIYLTACAKCHTVEPIGRYSLEEWQETLPEMADESKLTSSERAELTAYVLSAHQSMESPRR